MKNDQKYAFWAVLGAKIHKKPATTPEISKVSNENEIFQILTDPIYQEKSPLSPWIGVESHKIEFSVKTRGVILVLDYYFQNCTIR